MDQTIYYIYIYIYINHVSIRCTSNINVVTCCTSLMYHKTLNTIYICIVGSNSIENLPIKIDQNYRYNAIPYSKFYTFWYSNIDTYFIAAGAL